MKFNRRLENAILNKYKNISQFVEHSKLNDSVVRGYVKGTSVPSIAKVEELADLLDVSPAWLAYGIQTDIIPKEKLEENVDVINTIHEKLDEWLESRDKVISSVNKSKIVKVVYKQLMEKQSISSESIQNQVTSAMEILDVA